MMVRAVVMMVMKMRTMGVRVIMMKVMQVVRTNS